MRKGRMALTLFVILSIGLLVIWVSHQNPTPSPTHLEKTFDVYLKVNGVVVANDTTLNIGPKDKLRIELEVISYKVRFNNLVIGLSLPEDFKIISGNLTWSGMLSEGEVKKIFVEASALKTGSWSIIGTVKGEAVDKKGRRFQVNIVRRLLVQSTPNGPGAIADNNENVTEATEK
ncbi:MAG: hypothetical protein GXO63_01355 [Candidatus Micrarchaeota archaeon]|nr:hypothetical protein [Candidatus Micrarchaeota archaeon]